jgi:hypothetical protein
MIALFLVEIISKRNLNYYLFKYEERTENRECRADKIMQLASNAQHRQPQIAAAISDC